MLCLCDFTTLTRPFVNANIMIVIIVTHECINGELTTDFLFIFSHNFTAHLISGMNVVSVEARKTIKRREKKDQARNTPRPPANLGWPPVERDLLAFINPP